MANHVIKDPKIFTDTLRRLEVSDSNHADLTFNPLFQALINNDAFLKALADSLAESLAQVGQETEDTSQALATHKTETTQRAHLAKNIGLEDIADNFTATELEGALSELFTNVSNGKSLIATAITDKGVSTSGSDTFPKMASNISEIKTTIIAKYDFAGYSTFELFMRFGFDPIRAMNM